MELTAPGAEAPPRLTLALAALAAQREAGVHFAPIRHHSPGCAAALVALLDEVQPACVLIEGPAEYRSLLPALTDERTQPPIAALSITDSGAAFYPLAEFSPEWIGLRWGAAHGADVAFIDQPWALQHDDADTDARVRTLQAEQHLAHSASIARLAQRLGCRDHDEVWEHLFEVRGTDALSDWRSYFTDVLAWAGMARLDYHRDALDADHTHGREAVMSAMIANHLGHGPVVIITGAFHTMALLEVITDAPEAAWVVAHPATAATTDPAWLIRYDYNRLDGLRGYGAGMPAPGFWQRSWQARQAGLGPAEFSVDVLLDVATLLRAEGLLLSSTQVEAATLQALRLAELRGRAWPGRTDLLDAMLTCYASDDGGFTGPLAAAVTTCFGGSALGELPPGQAAPPLVAEVRTTASKLRFTISDSTKRQVHLDTARKPAHVRRREFLAQLQFLKVGFATQIGGADLVAGAGAGLLFEDWEYAWTPMTEAALIEVGLTSPTLALAVAGRLQDRLGDPDRDSSSVARLITEILVMGAGDHLVDALALLGRCYDTDPSLASITDSLHRLWLLLQESGRLALGHHRDTIAALLSSGLAAAAYQVSQLEGVSADGLGEACDSVIRLHALLGRVQTDDAASTGTTAVARELRALRQDGRTPARLHGVLIGLAAVDGDLNTSELSGAVAAHLSPGADPEVLAGFLSGLMQAAPGLVLHQPELLASIDESLAALDEPSFLQILPDLRKAFTWLKPSETHQLAHQLGELTGANASELDVVFSVTPALAARGQAAERELLLSLARDGLSGRLA